MNKVSKVVAFAALVVCAAVLPAFAADQGTMFGGANAPVQKKNVKKHAKKVVHPMADAATAAKKM